MMGRLRQLVGVGLFGDLGLQGFGDYRFGPKG